MPDVIPFPRTAVLIEFARAPFIASAGPGDSAADALQAKQARLDQTEIEMAAIKDEGATLYQRVAALIEAFAGKHGCQPDLEPVGREIDYLVNDATGPAWRRKVKLEDEIEQLREIAP